ncbi:spherulation-specific family 4 protein [Bacillus thuringiensis]|uniref:spherulation-specific family 4 protein n=1 Tax=Bacillus thuringiensis TaxID=1428 RepID=UPI0021D65AAE|nr:spherulation-specific family 4 protein [Bacillus thuringiensis]MCU7667406.1 spherulation-specific family 4 protein [Bacillus thuringiensis]
MQKYIIRLLIPLMSLLLIIVQSPRVEASDNLAKPINQLCIFYGWSTYINNSGGIIDKAVQQYENCKVVILGDGMEHSSHEDHENTKTMIPILTSKGIEVYGYVTIGVSTVNLDEKTWKQYIDEWKSMGVTGIFLDEAGYDYGVTRERQNAVIDYIHDSGMEVFINAWNIDDALADKDEKGNDNPSHMKNRDWFLLEDWRIGQGNSEKLSDMVNRGQKAIDYKKQKGIRIATVTTKNSPKNTDNTLANYQIAWWSATSYGFDAYQWTDSVYSSNNSKLIFYPILNNDYGTIFTSESPQLVNGKYERYTDKGTIVFDNTSASFTPNSNVIEVGVMTDTYQDSELTTKVDKIPPGSYSVYKDEGDACLILYNQQATWINKQTIGTPVTNIFSVPETTYIYDAPDDESEVLGSLAAQDVNVTMEVGDWKRINSWIGPVWINTNKDIPGEDLILTEKTSLFDSNNVLSIRLEHLSPQTVKVLKKEGEWMKIKTWLGPKYINANFTIKKLGIYENINLYDDKREDTKSPETLSPQIVTVIKEEGDWKLIKTWLGPKYIHTNGIEDVENYNLKEESITIDERKMLYYHPKESEKTTYSVAPQTVRVIGKYKEYKLIQTWMGFMWIK